MRIGDDDPAEPLLEFRQGFGEAERGHDLGGRRDVEARLAGDGIAGAAQADDHLPERALVHVEHAAPDDAALVYAQRVAEMQVVVEHRGQEVVGGGDDVEVAVEMQVDLLHRRDLGIAAAGAAALDAEAGAHGRFAQADDGSLAEAIEGVGQADAGGGLAFAGRGGVDGRDEDQLAGGGIGEPPVEVETDLGLGLAEELEVFLLNAQLGGDGLDGLQFRLAGDL